MDKDALKNLLTQVKHGTLDIDQALESLKDLPFEDLGFAKVDHHRCLRKGFPEVIFCQGKQPEQVASIIERLLPTCNQILATRANQEVYAVVNKMCPDAKYHSLARCITIEKEARPKYQSPVLVISAGTADLPVAEEASVTAEIMGNTVTRLYDVGVAGIHRLFHYKSLIDQAAVIIVVAGMEGALASVVGGLVDVPVVAVPTSIGYGAAFGGLAALLAMLNSCAAGIAVVNIDNGFGAAAMAAAIVRLKEGK
ncbi:MAG: nickel pincer cofactor biosynthesis protein LarB [Eubacteriales bacterium]